MAAQFLRGPLPNLGLGCWLFGQSAPDSSEEILSLKVIGAAYEAGIRHFDTAADYGNGRSEELLGRALGSKPDALIASKMHMADSIQVRKGIEACRRRIKRDVIDLFYVHWPKTGMDPRPMMEVLEDAKARGKIRFIGVSNFSVDDLESARESAQIDVYQIGYNLLWRKPEVDVLPYCRQAGIAVVTYSSLAQGLLTGKFIEKPRFDPGDPRPGTVFYDPSVWPRVYAAVEKMKVVAAAVGCPLGRLALRWLTDYECVDMVLAGARTLAQLGQNIESMKGAAPIDALKRLDAISKELAPFIPEIGNMFKYRP